MYSLPVTLVGLRLCMLGADLTGISTCFVVAMACSWVAMLVAWYFSRCMKPSSLVVVGLLIMLTSSFFMLDYSDVSLVDQVKNRLTMGLGLAAFGFTICQKGINL